MNHYSLRWRLLAGAAVAIFAALAIAWGVMTFLFQEQLEQRVEQELLRDALQLVAGFSADANGAILVQQPPTDPRFETPASGLYWQLSGPSATERSRSLWDEVLATSPGADALEWRTRVIDGPFGQRLFLIERMISPVGSADNVLVQLALDENEITASRAEFSRTLALFLLLLWAVLSGAAWIQVQLGLKPLGRLRHELLSLRNNAAERLNAKYPPEVAPLTDAINDLASAREADVKRARQRAADLAHGLKTPLAALAAQSRLIREGSGDLDLAADRLDKAISAAASAVEAELARARAAASRHASQDLEVDPRVVALRLISVLEHTEKGMRLDYQVALSEGLRLPLAGEDFSEILGPLLENAVKFARRQVLISERRTDQAVILSVEDDGPGLTPEDAAKVVRRGVRLDETGGGHGLGLAIARELAEATGGTLSLGASALGGLRVDLGWKIAAAGGERSAPAMSRIFDAIRSRSARRTPKATEQPSRSTPVPKTS
jgi:signal transduction histidine kinase